MLPTLKVGQVLEVDENAYATRAPEVGDIIAFYPPAGAQTTRCGARHRADSVCAHPTAKRSTMRFIKRVAAAPGDTIAVVHGAAVRDGHPQQQKFDQTCTDPVCEFPRPARIPADHWFVLGDNRGSSDDSRFWGPIPRAWIIGKVRGGNA